MTDNEIKEKNIEITELKIEKYPMAKSPHLIEYFIIMGYEESYIKEKILKNINLRNQSEQNEKNIESDLVYEFKCRHLPTILSSISSNFSEPIAEDKILIQNVFPIPPTIYYTSSNNLKYEPKQVNVIFTNIQNEVVNIGYSYIFYEKEYIYKSFVFIPKALVIISQYPFFHTFKNLCKELLYNNFKNDLIEIPLEIQLYNIVNFTPAPVNEKINYTFFPSSELFEITKCESDKDLINLNNQKIYSLNQLSGYRQSEIDFSVIFNVLPLNLIIQIYLQLLTRHTFAFFSKNIEKLNATIYIFQQFFYPLSHDETAYCLSPVRYFCAELLIQNIVGFLCSYDEINNYNPFRNVKPDEFKCLSENEEKEDFDYNLFECDFIVDLDSKKFIEKGNNKNMDNNEKQKNDKLEIVNFINNIFENDDNTELEISIIKLMKTLEKINSQLNCYEANKESPNYFNNNTKYNYIIQEAFYQFNLEISYQYFHSISKYNGDYRISKAEQLRRKKTYNESNLNEKDYLFLNLFSQTYYCHLLNNFIGGYSKDEPSLYKTPRLIFDYFISLKKILNHMNINNNKLTKNFFEIIDNIYFNKDKDNKVKEKDFSFLYFYKYYKHNLDISIYNLINNKYIESKLDKSKEENIKYCYKYKKIELDKNLLMNYIYIIEQMNKYEIKNIFNLDDDNYFFTYKPIEQNITLRHIYNSFENYYIESNYIELKDIIAISLINVVALSMNKKTVIHFTLYIYALFLKLFFSVRKYIEIILSIAIRLFQKDKEPNMHLYEIYFNLYKISIEANNLFPNDQLIFLKKLKDNISLKCKKKEDVDNKFKKIEKLELDKLYSLESQKRNKEILNILEDNENIIKGNIKNKIIFKSKFHKNKMIIYNDIYSPIMLYKISSELLESYYTDLDFNKVNKYKYDKLLICLLFYSQLLESDLPRDINKFLFYCLVIDYL